MIDIKKIFILFYVILGTLDASNYLGTISSQKIKKTIEKEEQIASAYKKYLLEKGTIPTLTNLIENDYLPKGFSIFNPFGKAMTINSKDGKSEIKTASLPKINSNLYDYYLSKNRVNTKSVLNSLTTDTNNVKIILSDKEKFIYEKSSEITTETPNNSDKTPKNKYYLDTNGVLHWYDENGDYKYSYDKNLMLDKSVKIFDERNDNKISDEYKNLVSNVISAGMTVFHENEENKTADEYVILNLDNLIKVNQRERDLGKTIIQFSRRAGGMIVNGDIYTWGNNGNRITGIDLGYSGKTDNNRYPVVTGLVRVKAKIYDDNLNDGKDFTKYYEQNYFSSPNRPKFIDFFSTVFYSTCGITTKGELYCGGTKGVKYYFGNNFTHIDSNRKGEMLYRSTFFNGTTNKAKKVFANNEIWHILSQDGILYRWGYDFGSGFSGNGYLTFNYKDRNYSKNPEIISQIKFSDITYLLTIGHRKIAGLSTTGDIYIWGREYYKDNSSQEYESYPCKNNWEDRAFNLCVPTKVEIDNSTMNTLIKFESIQGGLDAFVAKSEEGKYYKISHPKLKEIQVISIDEAIKSYSEYVAENDAEILSVDFSRKIDEQGLTKRYMPSSGIVWVNSKNELKGDYLSSSLNSEETEIFRNAIKQIKWTKIKVIDDDNGMCGIDINNQMYCWGIQSFYRNGNGKIDYIGNTFMIPVFNTNLFDMEKDFLVAEGGYYGYLTNMTSDEWVTTNADGKTGAFFMKYPTYIGGFNYEFTFK